MSPHTAEDIVRRATAAFNAGQRDEARRLCEQGLAGQPGDPMLSHLLAAVLFSQGEIEPARGHIETSLARRPGNAAARLLAARIARAGRDFDAALSHLDRAHRAGAAAGGVCRESPNARPGKSFAEKPAAASARGMAGDPEDRAAERRGRGTAGAAGLGGRRPRAAASLLERATAGDAPAPVWFDLGLVRQDLRDFDRRRHRLPQGVRAKA